MDASLLESPLDSAAVAAGGHAADVVRALLAAERHAATEVPVMAFHRGAPLARTTYNFVVRRAGVVQSHRGLLQTRRTPYLQACACCVKKLRRMTSCSTQSSWSRQDATELCQPV